MKNSSYNLFFDYPETSQSILYNSLYGSLVLLNNTEKSIIVEILNNPNPSQLNTHGSMYNTLCEEKFLIPNETNEIEIIENRKRLGIDDNNRLDIVLIPTLNCNFSCSYCYEDHFTSSMTNETTDSLIKWLMNVIPSFKFVLVHWYGGEPLLETNTLIRLSSLIKSIANDFDVELSIHITSNGYLFTKDNIRKLINCDIYDYQITLDGTRNYHNAFRPLKNGNPTFKKVFNNIISLAEYDNEVKISLRVNFNHLNIASIPDLLKQFPQKIRNQLRVVFEPIFGECSISAVDNITSTIISNKLSNYYRLAEELGYDVVLGLSHIYTGKLVYCYAERRNQYIINYNGDVFKCSVSNFSSKERVGYINGSGEYIKEEENYFSWVNEELFSSKCYDCKYLPLCMGGCRKMRITNKDTGSVCDLVPTNTSYLLKQIVFGGLNNLIKKEVL